jgi:hypothetical protein
MKMKRKLLCAASALLFLAIALVGMHTQPVRAGDMQQHISCVGTEVATWTPGLTNTTQSYQIGITDQWSTCMIRGGGQLPYTATAQAQFPVTESCTQLAVPAEATWIITWYKNGVPTGETSTFKFEATVNVSRGNFEISAPGSITGGLFKGQRAITTITLTNAAGEFANACDTTQGVTSLNGTSVLDIGGDD